MQKYAVMIKNSGNNCSKNRIYSSKQLNPLLKNYLYDDNENFTIQ